MQARQTTDGNTHNGVIRVSFSEKPVKLYPNSWVAKLAARKMRTSSVALVLGRTIYLHGTDVSNFLSHPAWVRHELAHVRQYQRLGYGRFLAIYLWQWATRGYHAISLEAEARAAEHHPNFSYHFRPDDLA